MRRHPTQWARNMRKEFYDAIRLLKSPSHTVGLELVMVKLYLYEKQAESPSHTVGLELDDGRAKPEEYLRLSPSHTVGLEPQNIGTVKSLEPR